MIIHFSVAVMTGRSSNKAQPDWAYEFPNGTGPGIQICRAGPSRLDSIWTYIFKHFTYQVWVINFHMISSLDTTVIGWTCQSLKEPAKHKFSNWMEPANSSDFNIVPFGRLSGSLSQLKPILKSKSFHSFWTILKKECSLCTAWELLPCIFTENLTLCNLHGNHFDVGLIRKCHNYAE